MKFRFDVPVGMYVGDQRLDLEGRVGIELEYEGDLVYPSSKPPKFWNFKPEGSLRNGMELVSPPLHLDQLSSALEELSSILKVSHVSNSIRCSTHVHVSVVQYTSRELFNFLCAYYLLENLLVRTQGNTREGNLFCLRLSDAEDMFNSLYHAATNGTPLTTYALDLYKYGALNVAAIQVFGTVEFRFLNAIINPVLLRTWVKNLHGLVHKSVKIPPHKLIGMYNNMPTNVFLETLFTKSFVSFICSNLSPEEVNSLLHTNYDSILELGNVLKRSKFKLPPSCSEDGDDRGGHDTFANITATELQQQMYHPEGTLNTGFTEMPQPPEEYLDEPEETQGDWSLGDSNPIFTTPFTTSDDSGTAS